MILDGTPGAPSAPSSLATGFDVRKVLRCARVIRVVGEDEPAGLQEAQVLARPEVREVELLPVVEEEDVDLVDAVGGAQLVKQLGRLAAQHGDDVLETREADEVARDGRELLVEFHAEHPDLLFISFLRVAVQGLQHLAPRNGRAAHVPAQFDQDFRSGRHVREEGATFLQLRRLEGHHARVRAGEILDRRDHGGRVVAECRLQVRPRED